MTNWKPWKEAHKFIGTYVLLKFDNGHIEDATIHEDSDGIPYYVLFDGESLTFHPYEIMEIPQ